MRALWLVLGALAATTAVVVGVAAALVMGGGDDNENGPAATNTPEAQTTGTPSGATSGDTLRLLGRDPITMDPACASDVDSAAYVIEIFGGLVTIDRDLKTVPDIAEAIPEPVQNADGTVSYTFQVRRGVLFHNQSRQVAAEDVKYSMERALNPDIQSPIAETYLGDIVGAKEFASTGEGEVSGIQLDPADPYKLTITIDAPKPYFLAKLTYPTAFVVDRNQTDGTSCFTNTNWQRRANGTGPFKLAEWDLGQRIVLEANSRYHLGAPLLARVEYNLAGGSAVTMYENDEIDVTGVGLNDIERIRDPNEPLNAEFQTGPRLDIWYIGFNVEKAPFDDVKVRQAFAHAIDKDKLIGTVLKDAVVEANGILPPGMPGYDVGLQGLEFDPVKAKQLLSESTYGDDLPAVEIASSGRGASVGPVSEAILGMWKENLGVEVAIRQTESGTFFQDLRDGDFQMFEVGWVADYVDPENFLKVKLYGDSKDNDSKYRNPEVDSLLEQADTEQDPATRLALYQQAEQIIVNDVPWIPLFHDEYSVLIKPYVKDYVLPPFVIPRMRYVHIEK
jgi:oligopeptide transport system substrate-binding protein